MENNLKPLNLCVVIQQKEIQNRTAPYLTKDKITELLQSIGQNIALHYPTIEQSTLIGIGSTYHLHQIIRPNFPIYTQLFELAKTRVRAKNFKPSIIGIGTDNDNFEIDLFNQEKNQFPEILQILPFSTILPDNKKSEEFFTLLEAELINNAHLNQTLIDKCEELFNISIENISIVTLADLNGLFASQLIQIGLEELWDIIKSVIFNLDEMIVTLGSGHILYWKWDEVALLTVHPSIFDKAMSDYQQTFETYNTTTLRLEQLFKSHRIPYMKSEIIDPYFFTQKMTITHAKLALESHIKAL